MKEKFCDNELCQYHVDCDPEQSYLNSVDMDEAGRLHYQSYYRQMRENVETKIHRQN